MSQLNVNLQTRQPSMLLRIVYYIFIGWWAGFLWLNIGYFLCLIVIGLPLGLVMLNRLPTILTLRPASQNVTMQTVGSVTTITMSGATQCPLWQRALYFLLVGFWLAYLWAIVGYVLCLLIVTLPIGLMMLNRVPAVLTLRRN